MALDIGIMNVGTLTPAPPGAEGRLGLAECSRSRRAAKSNEAVESFNYYGKDV
jgi:hypothetical protein